MQIKQREINTRENTSFGAVHLKVSNLEKASYFWTQIAGLRLRSTKEETIEFGTENKTLVVVHKSANQPFLKGYSGLYHFAIHLTSEAELASVINRLDQRGYDYSPVDHTISKAVYFQDLEGITVEYTLETPERETPNSSGAPKALNVYEILEHLEDTDIDKTIDDSSFIGHIHIYANNVDKSNAFYKQIGFSQNKYNPQMVFADLSSGGDFGHRIALNSWHGVDRPLAPIDSAGLDHFQLNYKDKDELRAVLNSVSDYEQTTDGYWVEDPTGNKILLN